MEDKIYMKNQDGGIWEKNPNFAYAITMLLGMIPYFVITFLMTYILPDTAAVIIGFVLFIVVLVSMAIKLNQRHNMSKSTAFIQRDGKLYAVQLLYTKKELGTETSRNIIYMPSGTILQAAALKNNFEVAWDVQAHEKEVRERRQKAASFSVALDDILGYLKVNPKKYHLLPDSKRSKLDNLFMYNVENNGLVDIETKNAKYKFLILNNPEIINQNKKQFTINFYNEKNELCTAKFSNCYGNIVDGINKYLPKVPQSE